jgi:hypothetical protein
VGCPTPLQPDERAISTPGGTRTRSFRVEGPASSPFRPRGQESSGGRTRTCLSRLTVARLPDSTTPERKRRQQDSNLRTAHTVYAIATRCLANSAMPPGAEGEGVEPPRPAGPPVFETGYRAGGSPSEGGPGRRRTCNPPLKRRELCRVELRSRDVTGRGRTCAARVSDGRSTALSYGHVKWAEPESNRRPPPYQRGALPPELSA